MLATNIRQPPPAHRTSELPVIHLEKVAACPVRTSRARWSWLASYRGWFSALTHDKGPSSCGTTGVNHVQVPEVKHASETTSAPENVMTCHAQRHASAWEEKTARIHARLHPLTPLMRKTMMTMKRDNHICGGFSYTRLYSGGTTVQ